MRETASAIGMKSVQTFSFQNFEGNGAWRVEPPVDVAATGLPSGPTRDRRNLESLA